MSNTTISPPELHALLISEAEHALIDVREVGPFSLGHLLFAVPLPLGRLEVLVGDLLPRRDIALVICDDGEGLAQRAAVRLGEFGYTDARILEGGISGWRAAEYPIYSGINVPSKAFGEFVEHEAGTPSLSASEVHEMVESGEDLVILDSRPFEEFHWASIPGGLCCSGAELVYRGFSAVTSPSTKVIVNCAGRTRSIIGAQSLINAGLPNPVFALENGIMGWRLAGLDPATRQTARAPAPDADGLSKSRAAAEKVAARFDIQAMSAPELNAWRRERQERSLYILDVRTIEEYEAGHLYDAVHAPGGQVIQATDQFVGARNARIVLVDNDGVRATMTASWLVQMGQSDVRVFSLDRVSEVLSTGVRHTPVPGLDRVGVARVSPDEAERMVDEGALVLDASLSPAYRREHIPGAWYIARSRLADSLHALPTASCWLLTSEDGVIARLASTELTGLTDLPVHCIDGGNAAWRSAGKPTVASDLNFAVEPTDTWRSPFSGNRPDTVYDAMREYLDWEVGLMAQLRQDSSIRFKTFS